MGYIRDHAIVIVSAYGDWIDKAQVEAWTIFPWVSGVSPEAVNGSRSFFIPPDGSKEGWTASDDGDDRRQRFITYLRSICYEDGSCPLKWVEVRVSDDDDQLFIENSDRLSVPSNA